MNRHVALPWVLVAGLSVMWLMQSLNPVPCTPDVIANIKVPAPTPRSRAPTPIATTEPPMPELPEPAPFTLPKRRWVGRECLEGGAIRPDQQPTKWCSDFSSKLYENDPAPAARCESTDPWLEGIGARNQSTFCVMKRGEFDTAITSEALWKLYKTLEYKFRRCRTEDALRHAQLKLDGFSMYLNMSEACGGWNVTFTAEEYLAILHVHSDNGTRPIVFSGDSVTRQTFTRIIFHIRGLSRAIEWSSWGDTSYNVYAKEDHVMINTLESIPEQTHQKRHRVVGALVQLLFLWEPKATPEFQHWIEAWHPIGVTTVNQSSCDVLNFRIHTGDLAVLHTSALPAIHVHSRNYWIENVNNSISSLKKFTYDISQIARATKKRKGCPTLPYHYFQFATPFTEGPQGEGWEWKIPLQNRAGAEMVEEAQSEIQEPWKRGSIVRHKPSMAFFDVNAGPMSGLSEADLKRLRSRDGTHFQCAYLKAFPQPIELMYPNELDCIDPAELGFWHWMAVVFVTMRA